MLVVCWHWSDSWPSRLYATVGRPSVCAILPLHPTAAGLLLWVRRAEDIDRLICCTHRCKKRFLALFLLWSRFLVFFYFPNVFMFKKRWQSS